ncbi:MAG TPA: hypothetical protein VGD26_08055 [Chitinophagaceae bacterium]
MDAVHLHLISNHVPIIGAFFGIVVLLFGMARQSPPTLAAAYSVFLISAAVGLIAYFSGEGAEEAVENLPGVTHEVIEAHEEVALYVLITYVLLAIVSFVGLVRSKNHYSRIKGIAIIVLFISLISFALAAYTGWQGGQIRHTELRSAGSTPATDVTEEREEK